MDKRGFKDRSGREFWIKRKALMNAVQKEYQETIQWIDCGFYLIPVDSLKLSEFGISWHDVKIVDPLKSICSSFSQAVPLEPVIPLIAHSKVQVESPPKHKFPRNLSFSQMLPRVFFSLHL